MLMENGKIKVPVQIGNGHSIVAVIDTSSLNARRSDAPRYLPNMWWYWAFAPIPPDMMPATPARTYLRRDRRAVLQPCHLLPTRSISAEEEKRARAPSCRGQYSEADRDQQYSSAAMAKDSTPGSQRGALGRCAYPRFGAGDGRTASPAHLCRAPGQHRLYVTLAYAGGVPLPVRERARAIIYCPDW